MKMNKLDKRVLKLWYIRAAIGTLAIIGVLVSVLSFVYGSELSPDTALAVSIGIAVPVGLIVCLILILPALRYKAYEWGYDDKRIIVKQGVIFKQRVVIPVCQIQDLHRTQGPVMTVLKLGDVTISTAGSNFDISTLTTEEADSLIDALEQKLEARVEELKNEEI